MSKDIKLTVWLSTYNQEPYVAQALDSILMQKTDFPFEILAADDCSTDGTQAIILDYQKRYPDKIVTYFTPVNVGGCRKLVDCIDNGLFQGDYIAPLEGDDYWLETDRLQTLVDFLEANPQYSRVSHKRMVINERDEFVGYDTKPDVLGTAVTMEGFLNGQLYSDFGAVYRNYFRQAGGKYNELFLASRNVCDFQDMFITQDFGPVYVMDRCFGVYRSRSVAGATNYNSVTTNAARRKDNIRLCRAVERFYQGKYDLTPMIRRNQRQLLDDAIQSGDRQAFQEAREYFLPKEMEAVLPEIFYLLIRGKRRTPLRFLRAQLTGRERAAAVPGFIRYAALRIRNKILKKKSNPLLRGYIVKVEQ